MTPLSGEDAMAALDFDAAASVTDRPRWCEAWRSGFAESAGWVGFEAVGVPRGAELEALGARFGFPAIATRLLLEHRAGWDEPRIRRLGAHVQWMTAHRYTTGGSIHLGWPPVFSCFPLFYAFAALGLARRVEVEQADRGIDAAVTRATLWDIGQQVALHHRVHGEPGMSKGWWLCHHLSHQLFRLGRLQHQHSRAKAALGPIAPEEPFLDVHIPEDGALDALACDASFDAARAFFPRHFVDESTRYFACASWLLDPVLESLAPAGSNIVQFQRRFELHELREGSSSVFEFVFDRPDLDAADAPECSELPRDTRLRAAIVDHFARGGAIRTGVGTIRI